MGDDYRIKQAEIERYQKQDTHAVIMKNYEGKIIF